MKFNQSKSYRVIFCDKKLWERETLTINIDSRINGNDAILFELKKEIRECFNIKVENLHIYSIERL